MPAIRLRTEDGAQATILLHGAQVISWKPPRGGERIYLSEESHFAEGCAVRGGIPVLFPQFGKQGELPSHGFARDRNWELVSAWGDGDQVQALLRLTDSPATRQIWPHGFRVELCVSICSDRLVVEITVENTGASAFSFTGGLHTYLRVDEISDAYVLGLQGCEYFDNLVGYERLDHEASLRVSSEVDRVYYGVDRPVQLREPARCLVIGNHRLPDVVIWNPWEQGCARLKDMPPDGYRKMLCVEAATIQRAIGLAPGESWCGKQVLDAAC